MKYSRIEFVIGTAIFIVVMFAFISHSPASRLIWIVPRMQATVITYGAFLVLNFYVLPRYMLKKNLIEAIGLAFIILLTLSLSYMVLFSYTRAWMYNTGAEAKVNMLLFSRGMVMAGIAFFCYGVYAAIREMVMFQYRASKDGQNLSSRVKWEVILTFSIWAAIMVFVWGYNMPPIIIFFFSFCLPYCIIVFFLNLYWLIPQYRKTGAHGISKYVLNLLMVAFLAGIVELAFLLQAHEFSFTGYLVIFWLVPTPIAITISWWVYLANEDRYRQLANLKTALGTSNANLQYLRSQINPHFLFNALNTLYGTALLEKADKTGEGIQKLGDMMRFMLHENNQDKIALSREIEYLHNYIDLQNMRLALSPDITVDIQIEDMIGYEEIAPMLLIPFVENAYKHGISLQEKSWINVSIYKRDGMLHLDVHNSIHPANANDPERYHSGTGLDNVRQRLQLLYPQTHELVVRQNSREFFVHLSLTLNSQKPN